MQDQDKQKTPTVHVGKPVRSVVGPRTVIKLLMVLVAAGLLGGFVFFSVQNNKQDDNQALGEVVMPCSDDSEGSILNRIASIDPANYEFMQQVEPIIEEITSAEGYANDPNCLYPLVVYYVFIGDPEASRQYYEQLSETYSEDAISDMFVYRISLDSMKFYVEHLEDVERQAAENTIFLGEVIEE